MSLLFCNQFVGVNLTSYGRPTPKMLSVEDNSLVSFNSRSKEKKPQKKKDGKKNMRVTNASRNSNVVMWT